MVVLLSSVIRIFDKDSAKELVEESEWKRMLKERLGDEEKDYAS